MIVKPIARTPANHQIVDSAYARDSFLQRSVFNVPWREIETIKRPSSGVGPASSSLFSELVASLSGRQKLEEELPKTAADHLARKREGSSYRSLRSKREHLQFPCAIPFQVLTALYVRLFSEGRSCHCSNEFSITHGFRCIRARIHVQAGQSPWIINSNWPPQT